MIIAASSRYYYFSLYTDSFGTFPAYFLGGVSAEVILGQINAPWLCSMVVVDKP
jgi:hypothetical protein